MDFDGKGYATFSFEVSAKYMARHDIQDQIERENKSKSKVSDITLRLRDRKLKNETQWELSAQQDAWIAADVMGYQRPEGTFPIPFLRR